MDLDAKEPVLEQFYATRRSQCWYCGKHVGLIGRGIAWLVGLGFHGCDFSNVRPPRAEVTPALRDAWRDYRRNSNQE